MALSPKLSLVQGAIPGPTGLQHTGLWDDLRQYGERQTVRYGGATYIARVGNINSRPDLNPAKWELLVEKGGKGDKGDTGAKGDKGDRGDRGAQGEASVVPGPKGDKGSQGDPSTVPGPKGDQGNDSMVPGPKGDKGENGEKGDKGDQGDDSIVPGPKGDQGDRGFDGDVLRGVNRQTGAAYTLVLDDLGKAVERDVAGNNTIIVPAQADVAWPDNVTVHLLQSGVGTTTVVAADGTVIIRSYGNRFQFAGQEAWATLIRLGENRWSLTGNLK